MPDRRQTSHEWFRADVQSNAGSVETVARHSGASTSTAGSTRNVIEGLKPDQVDHISTGHELERVAEHRVEPTHNNVGERASWRPRGARAADPAGR